MSELITTINNKLRDIYNNHDIDFRDSRGIKIGTKTYPAINKRLVLDNDGYETHSFHIPFENGHTAEWHITEFDMNDNQGRYVSSTVSNMVPLHKLNNTRQPLFNTWFHTPSTVSKEHASYWENKRLSKPIVGSNISELQVEPKNHDNVHETLKRWASLPSKGLIHIGDSEPLPDYGDTYPITRDMTEEELQNYRQLPKPVSPLHTNALIKPPFNPRLIEIWHNSRTGSQTKLYNVETEELRNMYSE